MFQLTYIGFDVRSSAARPKRKLPRIVTAINREANNPDIAMLLAQYDYNQTLLSSAQASRKASLAKVNFAGVFLVDPFFSLPHYLEQLSSLGINGVSNFPSVAFYGEVFSNQLDEVNLGLAREIERLAEAREAGFEILPCLPESADAKLVQLATDLLTPSKWLIHNSLQISQSGNPPKLNAPGSPINQLPGEKFFYQRNVDLSNLPPGYDGLAQADWWSNQP